MQGKKVPPLEGHSLESAVLEGTEADVMDEVIVKLAHAIDNCDSARDVKALIAAMFDALDRRRQLASVGSSGYKTESPLSIIMREAETA